VKFKLEIKLQQ